MPNYLASQQVIPGSPISIHGSQDVILFHVTLFAPPKRQLINTMIKRDARKCHQKEAFSSVGESKKYRLIDKHIGESFHH